MAAVAGAARATRLYHGRGGLHLPTTNKRISKITTELDGAKNVLRRRGFIVYDAEITEGIEWRGFVKCDQHIYTPGRIMQMAADVERAP